MRADCFVEPFLSMACPTAGTGVDRFLRLRRSLVGIRVMTRCGGKTRSENGIRTTDRNSPIPKHLWAIAQQVAKEQCAAEVQRHWEWAGTSSRPG